MTATKNFVRPTTADPEKVDFYAVCQTCGWQVYTPFFASAKYQADQHVRDCTDAFVEVDTVQYIGNATTAVQVQLDDRHGNYVAAGATTNSIRSTSQDGPVIRG